MHILCKLIRNAEDAQELANSKPRFMSKDYLDESDIEALKRVRLIYFRDRVEGIRRLMLAPLISSNFRENTVSEQVKQLREELGLNDLPDSFRADVLDEDRDAMELVELWFLKKQEA